MGLFVTLHRKYPTVAAFDPQNRVYLFYGVCIWASPLLACDCTLPTWAIICGINVFAMDASPAIFQLTSIRLGNASVQDKTLHAQDS